MKLFAPRSLWFRLIVGLLSLSLIGIGLASAMFLYRFRVTNLQFREQTLEIQAGVIAKVLRRAGAGEPFQLSDLSDGFRDGQGKYAVISERGELVAASPGVTSPLAPVNAETGRDFFILHGTKRQPPFYGLSTQANYGGKPVWIQIAFVSSGSVFDSVFKAFARDIALIWAAFVIISLSFNLIVARIGLAPLRAAAAGAAAIGPADVSARLPEKGLPQEVLALVKAVNRALDRLQQAFEAQQGFIADAAHELRTPIAVLKAHAAILSQDASLDSLKREISDLERLVNQLLDHAKIEGLILSPADRADLSAIAREVAEFLAPAALAQSKSIELDGATAPLQINGSHDFLFRALRNLVENGLSHTPVGQPVVIAVGDGPHLSVRDHGPGVPENKRELIFQRFWQGKRDRGGAGLGMDIVSRTVQAHAGHISVSDAPGGGAIFSIRFPSAPKID
jgi:signal transduction histidine kinase